MKKFVFALSLMLLLSMAGTASANYNIYKYKTDGYNFVITADGTDLQNIKSSKDTAWWYADYFAKWYMDNYLSGLRTAKEYQAALAKIDIRIPLVIAGTEKGIRYYIAMRLWYNLIQHAPKYSTQLSIYTVCPPYPSKWSVNGY